MIYSAIQKCECIITDEGNGILEIKNIATNPYFHRKGYGRTLIEFVAMKYKDQYSILQVGTGDSPLTMNLMRCISKECRRLKILIRSLVVLSILNISCRTENALNF